MAEKRIGLASVVSKFLEDVEKAKPASYYLGLESSEGFKPAADKMVAKLLKMDVNPDNGPFTREVVESFGIDSDILNEEVDNKMKRDWEIIQGKMTGGKGFGGMSADRMKEIVLNPGATMKELQSQDPLDAPLWTVKVLRRMGKEEVTVENFFLTNFFFNKLGEQKAKGTLGRALKSLFSFRKPKEQGEK